jgi:hypothetical protein
MGYIVYHEGEEILERGFAPLNKFYSPSPYQGEGDKGDRVTNKNLKG